MRNQLVEKAIDEFRDKTLKVYKADAERIVRDARGANRAAKDHTGRWLFELLQNSDDAKATEVLVLVNGDTVYVADNGCGFKPEAVSAICGTDFSDKTTGTIGRKGVGFKSVYEISQNPQVLTVDGEGVEFSYDRTKEWLHKNGLNDGHVPYQWIPFFISWDVAQERDANLQDLKAEDFKTVVRLSGLSPECKEKVEQLLMAWPPHALFAFRHLRQIKAPGIEVVLCTGDEIWSLRDSRGQTPVEWRVAKCTEFPSPELLEILASDEHKAVATDGVSFLIAAPFENDRVVPTSDYLPVHVFYPTEQKAPVRLLLHAEFLVKSDRTALMPVDGNPFNAWVADRLAYHVCKFVNDSYNRELPSSHIALLVPFGERASHPVADALWRRIAERAKVDLRLADLEARQQLTIGDAILIAVSVHPDLARTVLKATSARRQLLHCTFDEDKQAQKALRELGCKEINDEDLMAVIAENADLLADETEWVWACWEWLSAWVAKKPYGEEHRKRIEQVKALPIVPVGGRLLRASDHSGRIVTWKPDTGMGDLPEWLPLTLVEDWFRDRIQNIAGEETSVKKLMKDLRIEEPGTDVIQRAVGRAIEQYWKDRHGDPGRFLRFIIEQDWYKTSEASDKLKRCPVPLSQPVRGEAWAEAGKAYLGREWGNDLLAELYEGRDDIAWVNHIGGDAERERSILAWLGCATFPRIIEDRGTKGNGIYADELPDECRAWREQEFKYTERTLSVDSIGRLEALNIEELNDSQVYALLIFLAKHWKEYYQRHSQARLSWFYYTTRSRVINAFWWFQILHDIRPATTSGSAASALVDCWLPDKRTQRVIGSLLPVVDFDAFGEDKNAVQDWLISTVGLRTRIEQLTIEEWKALLSRRIPEKAPAERLMSEKRLRDKVTGWYTACLEALAEQENVPEKVFASCPLLCRKGGVWQYVADRPRYLNDDNDFATAFADDVWLFHIPTRLTADAVKYFGVLRLSGVAQIDVTPGEPKLPLSGKMRAQFDASLPYVWTWRSSQSKQDADRLAARLKRLRVLVVPALKASLSLGDVHHEVKRRWHVHDDIIYLQKEHANETELAQTLAKALDVRQEADFYENLLRCTDDDQRKEKLLSKGIADAEIDRCLREYSGQPAEEDPEKDHDKGPQKPPQREQDGSITQRPSNGGTQGEQGKQPQAAQSGETSEATSSVFQECGKQYLRLKDPRTTTYVLGSPPSGGARIGGCGESGDMKRQANSLTDAEKAVLEEAGRTLATRELESMGYSVEKMPQGNPGFDLRASKDGDELRVEVKAHSGRATVVEVTHREYKEYLGQQGYRWELWNVEHLAEDDSLQVVITRYDHIPDDALAVRTFRVDLKKCKKGNKKRREAI